MLQSVITQLDSLLTLLGVIDWKYHKNNILFFYFLEKKKLKCCHLICCCLVLLTQGINICSFTIKINKCHSHSETKLFITQTLESFEIFLIQFFSIFYDDHHVLLDLYFGQIPEVWTQVKTEYNQLSWHHTSINHEKVTSHFTSNLCSIIYKHFDVYKLQHCKTILSISFQKHFFEIWNNKNIFYLNYFDNKEERQWHSCGNEETWENCEQLGKYTGTFITDWNI